MHTPDGSISAGAASPLPHRIGYPRFLRRALIEATDGTFAFSPRSRSSASTPGRTR
jgi:hypothetical protein